MTESTVQADACSNCGVGTRDEAEFCYNCGTRIVQKDSDPEEEESSNLSDLNLPRHDPSGDRIPMPDISIEAAEPIAEKPISVEKPMRTAASLRQDRGRHLAKPKEVVWVEREGPGLAFVISSLIIVIITAIILFGAVYLK